MSKKQELGKGIRALLQSMDEREEKPVIQKKSPSSDTSLIPIDQIRPNPEQPRKEFAQEPLEELAQSIHSLGLIQPLTVRKISTGDYQIIAGERRYRAAKIAGLKEVPCFIRKADDTSLLEMGLVENIQRQDLNPIEVAISFDRLIRECGITQEELGGRVGKKRSTITNYVRLLKLPPEIQKALKSEIISMGHARALAGVEDALTQLQYFKTVLTRELSVRKTEELVAGSSLSGKAENQTADAEKINPEIRRIVDQLSARFGTKISIERNAKGRGRIIVPFSSDQELNSILDNLEEL